ncbi:MAG: purine-nucleoside phosphorylase, partial [Defluviitaleaceae bacterium]|nr:purine-nucleoside phosphorylase [Defluviitaleaceae bacterium]
PGNFAPVANFALVERAVAAARAARADFVIGNILSSDTFYGDDPTAMAAWKKMGILAVEMEAAALYATAARLNRAALAILTISDMIFTHEATSSAEREKSFTQMMEIALNAATD